MSTAASTPADDPGPAVHVPHAEVVDVLGVRRRSSSASSPARDSVDAEFTAFMTTHGPALLRTAWLLCGDGHRAEELTQQALVRTYAAWPRARRDPLAYARRILVNLRVDTWRRRRREVLTSPDEMPDTAGTVRVGASVSDDHARTEDRDQLVRALALLSPRQRRIVVLRHLVDLPEAEVAAVLGVSVGTVKSTSSRGLATLREALTDDREGDAR